MVSTLLALMLARAVAEIPDESALLQMHARHRNPSCAMPDDWTPDAVVEWSANNRGRVEDWATYCPTESAEWVASNPDAATQMFYENHDLAQIMFPGTLAKTMLPGTKCMDGSTAGYYSNIKDESEDWVIWMEGGGGCTGVAECATYMKKSSHFWDNEDNTIKYGLYSGNGALKASSQWNPHFHEANHVYIRYCSGDTHTGRRNVTNATYGGWYMSGHLNFQAIIQDLKATKSLDSASRVLLTGCSAGGMGVVSNADFLQQWLPEAIVKAAPIAGWFMPDHASDQDETWMSVSFYDDYSAGVPTGPDLAEAIWSAKQDWADAAVPDACVAAESSHVERCMNMPTLANHMETPIFISQNMWDSYHFNMEGNKIPTNSARWTNKQWNWAVYYANAVQNSTSFVGNQEGNGLFLPASISHGGDIGKSTQGAIINGLKYLNVLADWFYDRDAFDTHVLIDACHDKQTCKDKLD